MRYFLVGFMGCGKSYWAKSWAAATGLKYYDLDEEIEKREQMTIADIFRQKGEAAFRKQERHALETYMQLDDFIMSCGGGTPCFHNNMQLMNQKGVTIFLDSTVAELTERLRFEKESRPLLQGVADDVLGTFIEEKLNQRRSCYAAAMYHLHTRFLTNENFEKIVRRHEKK